MACTSTTHPIDDTTAARRLRLLALASVPLSATLAMLSIFARIRRVLLTSEHNSYRSQIMTGAPHSVPSVDCISSLLFAALFCQLVQAFHVVVTRSVVGLVSLVSVASTATVIGFELGAFILTVLSVYDYEPEYDPDYDADYDTEYGIDVSWSSKLVVPVVVLLWVQIAVLCATFVHMVLVRRRAALKDAAGPPTLRKLTIACALCSWLVFVLSMAGDLGMSSYFVFPVTGGLCAFYYTAASILHQIRPRPALFTSGWAAAFAFLVGLTEASFFCLWLATVVVEVEYQSDGYVDSWFPYATPGMLIVITIFVLPKMYTLMCLSVGGLTVPKGGEASSDPATAERAILKRHSSVASEAEYLGK